MNMKFVRFAQGFTNSSLLPITDNTIDIIRKNPKKDFYTSLYRYSDHHLEHFNKTKSVAGIHDVTTPKILFDFDDAQNIEGARRDAVVVCGRLVENGVPEDKLRIYFSGNKGFGVEVLTKEEMSRQQFVNVVFNLAGDLKTFDTRINDEARIIRAPFSQHQESKLYKIPLTLNELVDLSIDQIKQYASEQGLENYDDTVLSDKHYEISMPEKLKLLKEKTFKKVGPIEVTTNLKFDTNDIDWSKCPKWMARERYALQEGYFYGSETADQGERNIAFMILAATYKNQGFSLDHTLGLLMATAEKQAGRTKENPYTEEQMKREIVNPVFSASWQGGIYGRDERILEITRQRFNILKPSSNIDLVAIDNVADEFKDFAKNIDRNTIKTGLKTLDDNVLITSGMMVSLLAAPGAGKTSFANLFVENLNMNKENTIYFSLDMYKNLLFSRLLQKYSGYDMRKILSMYKEDKPDKVLTAAYAEVLKNYSNANFNFRSGPTVEEIEQEIVNYQEETGKEVKLVVIDYLEKVRGPFSDSTANSAYVASRLSDIAKKYHTTVLLLVQPQKSAGDPREELVSYRKIKGASVIEQDSRVILTMSRPGYNPKDMSNDKFATISVVKNNMGNLCQLDYKWEGISGMLSALTFEEEEDLKTLRSEIAAEQKTNAAQYI